MVRKGLGLLVVLGLLLTAVGVISPACCASSAAETTEVSDEELAGVTGKGLEDLDLVEGCGISLSFSDIDGNAFQNAQGIIIITQVPGDGNTINLTIDFNIVVYFIYTDGGPVDIDIICDEVIPSP